MLNQESFLMQDLDSGDSKHTLVFFIGNNLDTGKERWLAEKTATWCREDVSDFKDKNEYLRLSKMHSGPHQSSLSIHEKHILKSLLGIIIFNIKCSYVPLKYYTTSQSPTIPLAAEQPTKINVWLYEDMYQNMHRSSIHKWSQTRAKWNVQWEKHG